MDASEGSGPILVTDVSPIGSSAPAAAAPTTDEAMTTPVATAIPRIEIRFFTGGSFQQGSRLGQRGRRSGTADPATPRGRRHAVVITQSHEVVTTPRAVLLIAHATTAPARANSAAVCSVTRRTVFPRTRESPVTQCDRALVPRAVCSGRDVLQQLRDERRD